MRSISVIIILSLALWACNKNTPEPPVPVSHVVVSVGTHSPYQHRYIADSFVRDAAGRLVKLLRIYCDSTTMPVTTTIGGYQFSYNGSDSVPSTYTIGTDNYQVRHDGSGRIIWDSSATVQNTYYFTYASNTIAMDQTFPPSIGHFTDTMTLTDGNITSRITWFFAPTYTQVTQYSYTYTSLVNPFQFPLLMSPLLNQMSSGPDYISKNLYASAQSGPSASEQVTWHTDRYGRVTGADKVLNVSGTSYRQTIDINYQQ